MAVESKTLNVGIIGCGRVTQRRHLPILDRLSGVRIAALADTDTLRLSQVADQYRIQRRYANHRDLLEANSIDAVLVCTPPGDHFVHARDVLESGRHLYLEPPLALTAVQCQTLVGLGQRSKRIATVGMHLRYHPLLQRAKQAIRAGRLGPVQAIIATYSTPSRGWRQDILPSWRDPGSVAGSVLMESAIHYFDVWSMLTGARLDELSVRPAHPGGPVAMHAVMQSAETTTHAESIVVSAVFSEFSGNNSEMRLIGSEGSLSLSLYKFNGFSYCPARREHGASRQYLAALAEVVRSLPRAANTLFRGDEFSRTFSRQLKAFVCAARGGQAPLASLAEASNCTRAVLAAVEAAATGRSVQTASIG